VESSASAFVLPFQLLPLRAFSLFQREEAAKVAVTTFS
jgi:hypothetical protein